MGSGMGAGHEDRPPGRLRACRGCTVVTGHLKEALPTCPLLALSCAVSGTPLSPYIFFFLRTPSVWEIWITWNPMRPFQVYSLVCFDKCKFCKTITPIKIKNISSTPESFLMPPGNYRSDFCHHRFISPVLKSHQNGFKSIIPSSLTFLIQHNICKMHPYCCICQSFISFYLEVCHCINIPWLVYSFTCWWTMGDFQWELLKMSYLSISLQAFAEACAFISLG